MPLELQRVGQGTHKHSLPHGAWSPWQSAQEHAHRLPCFYYFKLLLYPFGRLTSSSSCKQVLNAVVYSKENAHPYYWLLAGHPYKEVQTILICLSLLSPKLVPLAPFLRQDSEEMRGNAWERWDLIWTPMSPMRHPWYCRQAVLYSRHLCSPHLLASLHLQSYQCLIWHVKALRMLPMKCGATVPWALLMV